MALSISEANTVSKNYFDDTITSQVYDTNVLFARLKQKNKLSVNGGVQLQWPIRYRELGAAVAVAPRQQIGYSQKETRTGALLDWKYYVGQGMISWDERVQNAGSAQVISLIKDKTQEMQDDLTEKFCDDTFATSQGTNNIQSIDTIVSTSSYAGISTTDAANWTGQVDSSTTRLVLYGTSGSLAHMINTCTFGKYSPDLGVTTRDLFNKLESLVEPQKRYEDVELANIGFTNLKFHGATFVADPHVTSAYMYLLTTEMLELATHSDYNFKVSDWSELGQAGFPNAMYKVISWAGNLMCRMRQVQGKYSALDYTL